MEGMSDFNQLRNFSGYRQSEEPFICSAAGLVVHGGTLKCHL